MSDYRDLYQEVILDHSKRPRNFRALEPAPSTREAEGHNPLCGDRVTVYVSVDGDAVRDVTFQGSGCAISKASSSIMTELVAGKTVDEVRELFERFHGLVTGEELDEAELGKLIVFAGVSEYPARVKCASLAWHVMKAALSASDEVVTTE